MKQVLGARAGFSLTEVLIAMALAGVLSLVVSQILINFQKGARRTELSLEVVDIKSRISAMIRDSKLCTDAFRTLKYEQGTGSASPLEWNELSFRNISILRKEPAMAGGGLRVEKIAIEGLKEIPGGIRQFSASLVTDFQFIIAGKKSEAPKRHLFPIFFSFGADGSLAECADLPTAVATADESRLLEPPPFRDEHTECEKALGLPAFHKKFHSYADKTTSNQRREFMYVYSGQMDTKCGKCDFSSYVFLEPTTNQPFPERSCQVYPNDIMRCGTCLRFPK